MCCYLFSTNPLAPDEKGHGKYGNALSPFAQHQTTFAVNMCRAPCQEPACCVAALLCFVPTQVYMRYQVLNHVHPDSQWTHYTCCQGLLGELAPGLEPGDCGERECPGSVCIMCLEATICPGLAVVSTANVLRAHYQLGLDADDVRLLRCNNVLQLSTHAACCCAACCPGVMTACCNNETCCCLLDTAAENVLCTAGLVECLLCATAACMTAQVQYEMKLRRNDESSLAAPQRQEMERYNSASSKEMDHTPNQTTAMMIQQPKDDDNGSNFT